MVRGIDHDAGIVADDTDQVVILGHFPNPKTDARADTAAKAELLSALAAEDEEDEEPL